MADDGDVQFVRETRTSGEEEDGVPAVFAAENQNRAKKIKEALEERLIAEKALQAAGG
jgi:hypothetical protein